MAEITIEYIVVSPWLCSFHVIGMNAFVKRCDSTPYDLKLLNRPIVKVKAGASVRIKDNTHFKLINVSVQHSKWFQIGSVFDCDSTKLWVHF